MVEEQQRAGETGPPSHPSAPTGPAPLRALDVHGIGVLVVGTAIFALLSVLALLCRARLRADGHGWWLGVVLVGVLLGLLALGYAVHRRHGLRRVSPPGPR